MLTCGFNSQALLKRKTQSSEAMSPPPELVLTDTEVLRCMREVVLHLCSNSVTENEIPPICLCALLCVTAPAQKQGLSLGHK